MKIDCLVVDDEPVARNIIRNYCSHLPFLHIVAECGNALEARAILSDRKIDLLFLDINLPVLNGIGFLSTLKDPPQVILTTAYQEYAVNAFDLSVCDYLLKPFSLERFIVGVDKAKEKLQQPQSVSKENNESKQDHIFVKSEGKIYKITYADCLFAEAQGNYTKIVMAANQILTKMPFSSFVELLPDAIFARVHRSYVVNKTKIGRIEGNRVFLQQAEVPIAPNYRSAFLRALGL